jgi:hypothetical protein
MLGIGCLAVTCYAGVWLAFQPPIDLLLSPDVTDSRMDAVGWWEWTLDYQAAGPAYAWYFTATHQLEASGWAPEEQHTGGPLRDRVVYIRTTWLGFVALCERVELTGDLYVAHARMRRWLTVPWSP